MAQQLLRQSFSKILSRYPPCGHISADSAFCRRTEISRQQIAGMSVWERDRQSGYRRSGGEPKLKRVRDAVKTLGSDMEMLGEETKQKFRTDPSALTMQQDGDAECVWTFCDQEKVDAWTVTTDSDNNEGHSQASFIFSKNKTGLFHGHLSKQAPKDGVTKRSGYCNIRSPTKYLSFKQEDVHDWSSFTHLLLKVRGDGRSYMLTINMEQHFDVFWHDQHHYTLFTHGGPYWQMEKIPFSKFYATSKGRIQDKQSPVQLEKVTHLGVSLGDDNEGPFSLEIDSISVTYDENHEEQFAYE